MANDKADFEVELVDDVSRPAKKAGGALNRLRRTLAQFGPRALTSFARSARNGFKDINDGIGPSFRSATNAGLNAFIGGFVEPMGNAFRELLKGAATATIGMVDFGQRSRQAFGLLAKEGEIPEQLFQRSIKLATDLGLNIKDTTKQIQKFRALQFSQNQAEALIKMGADMQALGASGEEVSRIFAQLGQIKAKNKLQSEELVTLAESGVSTQVVFAALAKQLNKTEDAVKDMVSKGEITGSQALNAIGTAILVKTGTKQFGDAGGMMAESTLSGMAGVMKARLQGVLFNIGDRAAPAITKTTNLLFDELNSFLDSDSGKKLFEGMADTVKLIAEGIRDALPFLKQFGAGFGEGASAAFTEVAGAFKMVFRWFSGGDGKAGLMIMRSLGQTVGALTVLLGGLVVAFGGAVAAMTFMTNVTLRTLKAIWDSFIGTIGSIVSGVADFWADLSAIWNAEGMSLGEKSYEIGKHVVLGLVRGMKELYMLPGDTMLGIAGNVINAAKGAFQQHSPSKLFEDIGKNNVIGLNRGHEMLPTQRAIMGTLGNDNGVAPVQGNLSAPGAFSAPASGGASKVINITVGDIHVAVAAGANAQETAELAAVAIRDAVHAYFSDLALEEAV